MPLLRQSLTRVSSRLWMTVPVMLMIGMAVLWGVFFYRHSRSVLEDQLKTLLRSTASIGAIGFRPEELDQIRLPSDATKSVYRSIIERLQNIRLTSPLIKSAYIMRRTKDPHVLSFVADADATLSKEQLDKNGDGIIQPDESAPLPGELYDITDEPTLSGSAFLYPSTNDNPTTDQWGTSISGYAPIVGASGRPVAVLGIDMDASDYEQLSLGIFSRLMLFLTSFVVILIASTFAFWLWRRKIRTQQELEREHTELLDLLLHQLGAPLAAIRWWVEILGDRDESKSFEDVHASLNEGVTRMSGIVSALLETSRIQSGDTSGLAGRASVNAAVLAAVEKTKTLMASRRQKIFVSPAQAECVVSLNPKSLTDIVGSVIDNASSYSPEGSTIKIAIGVDHRRTTIEVTDEGCGVAPEDLPKVGEKFFRAHNAAQLKTVGNGLALFAARSILERVGGSVVIASELGKGAKVTITLPVAKTKA